MREFKTGGFKLAQKAGVPVVPVTIIGSQRVLKKDSLVFHAGAITVIIDPPLSTEGYTSRTLPNLMEQTHAIIAGRLAEHSLSAEQIYELQKV